SVQNNLSVVLQEQARFRDSEPLERALLRERIRLLGSETVPVGVSWGNLGVVLAHLGDHAGSEDAFRKAHVLLARLLGSEHWQVANAARNVARIRLLRGAPHDSAEWFTRALEIQRKTVPDGTDYWFLRGQAAVATARTGRKREAARELRL